MSLPSTEAIDSREFIAPVLIVEDNLINQKVALALLERLGLTTELAVNGKEAVEAVSQRKFSVILMDCHMPIMDGFEAAVAIRKLQAHSDTYTPIIAITALAMSGDRERCIAAGMDDYLSKPIDVELLKVKLSHWMQSDIVYNKNKFARKFLRAHSHLRVLENDPVNLTELEEFYGADQLSQMLILYITDTTDMLRRIVLFLKERDARAVAGLAHEIKASCASIGAKHLARLCLYLEHAVGQQDWVEAEETLHSLEQSFDYFKQFVEPLLAEPEPAITN